MRGFAGWLIVAALLSACQEGRFVPIPTLRGSTRTLLVAAICDGAAQAQVIAATTEKIEQRVEDCSGPADLVLLEYDRSPADLGLSLGPLTSVDPAECLAAPLPTADANHVLTVHRRDHFSEVAELPADDARALASILYKKPCPCDPAFGVVDRLRLDRTAIWIDVAEIDAGSILAMSSANQPAVDFYRYDLRALAHILTATITVDTELTGTPSGTSALGSFHLTRGPPGIFYFARDFAELYRLDLATGLRSLGRAPRGRIAIAVAASTTSEDVYLLTRFPPALFRYRAGVWHDFGLDGPETTELSRHPRIAWAGGDRAVVVPNTGTDLLHINGDDLTRHRWDSFTNGALQALGAIPGRGVVAATKIDRFFDVSAEGAANLFPEVLGPVAKRMELSPGWFVELLPYAGGFVATLDDTRDLVRFDASWGYCPLTFFRMPEDLPSINRLARIGDTLVAAGRTGDAFAAGRPPQLLVLHPGAR